MFKNLLNTLKESNDVKQNASNSRLQDEKKLDKMSEYLVGQYQYSIPQIKGILSAAVKSFDINSVSHRSAMLNTIADVIMLELINKYNNGFIKLTNNLRSPLVIVTDLTQISLNTTDELQTFISPEERMTVNQFNEEAKYVRQYFIN